MNNKSFLKYNLLHFIKFSNLNFYGSILGPSRMESTLCVGISNSGEEEWNLTWRRYLESNIAAQKSHIQYALGCSKQIWILSRLVVKIIFIYFLTYQIFKQWT